MGQSNLFPTDEELIGYFYGYYFGKDLDALSLRDIVRRWVDIYFPITANKEFDDYIQQIVNEMKDDEEYCWGKGMSLEQFKLFVDDAIEEVAYVIQKFWLRMWSDDHLKVLMKMLEHGGKFKPCKGVEISDYDIECELNRREKEKLEDDPWPVSDCLP